MTSSVQLRDDYDAAELRELAKRSQGSRQILRLLALAAVYAGMSRADPAQVGGMDLQTLREWANRFNAEGPEGLTDRPRAGRPRQLTEAQMEELAEIVKTGSDPATDGIIRWRRVDLKWVIEARFGIVYSERTISRFAGQALLLLHQRPAAATAPGSARTRGVQKTPRARSQPT